MDDEPQQPIPERPTRLFGLPHPRGMRSLAGYWRRVDAVHDQQQRMLLVGLLALPLGALAVVGVLAGAVVTVGCLDVCIGDTGDPGLGGLLWGLGAFAGATWSAAAAWALGRPDWSRRVFVVVLLLGVSWFVLGLR